ncbi:MAG: hypothetical protein HZB53_03670 [Chloroflexi bacterium]|nr:hypothetical protein [Chloroflexota bacterium]
MSERDAEIIRASDVGLYAYCAKAWRLKADGHESANAAEMAAGAEAHESHGARVALYSTLQRTSILLAALAALALGLWLLTAR